MFQSLGLVAIEECRALAIRPAASSAIAKRKRQYREDPNLALGPVKGGIKRRVSSAMRTVEADAQEESDWFHPADYHFRIPVDKDASVDCGSVS